MEDTMLIQLTNKKAARLLHDMEDLELIKVLQENIVMKETKGKLSEKYNNVFSKEEGENLKTHIQQMRQEWNNI
jgi:hypothetical protein